MNHTETRLDARTTAKIIEKLGETLQTYYVFPDLAERISAHLQQHLQKGDYEDPIEGERLAALLSAHLQEVHQDKHLLVRWRPEPLEEQEGPLSMNEKWLEEWHLKARLDNQGLHKAERLPGNIGYLEIRRFNNPQYAGETAVGAMNFLANTDALLIDLRKCTGGNPDMVALISSYLLGEERVQLNTFRWRGEKREEQYWTLPYVPGKRFGDKPLYVLTSRETFSGGEEFAYNLKNLKRATLVGEATRGGANIGRPYRIHAHLEAFIPSGEPVNPVSGTNWEGGGVEPDIVVPAEQALECAYRKALEGLLERLGEDPQGALRGQAEEAREALRRLGG